MTDAVIFDLDGTLCDVSTTRHFVEGDERDFEAFHSASMECPPHDEVVRAAAAERDTGRAILIVTARSSKWRDYTIKWLDQHGIAYDRLYMRIEADFRADYVIKKDILENIKADGFEPIHAWDDKPKVIALWRENGIAVTEVPQ
ncbi:MAG: HAD family acid phosphatase [Aeromicrobium sp.]